MVSEDPLSFKDNKKYTDRIKTMQQTTGRFTHGKKGAKENGRKE